VSSHWAARVVVYTHRWLGIALGILFIVWFASGIVMMYAQMPELDPRERLARMQPINPDLIRVAPPMSGQIGRVTVAMIGDRPVYRLQSRPWLVVYADTGEQIHGLDRERALDVAAVFAPEHKLTLHYEEKLLDSDQWTFGVRALMPVHRIALGDANGTRVYVSDQTAEVVQVTTARGRRWGWYGAVLHWVYFTPFRRNASLWNDFIVWSSLIGTLICRSSGSGGASGASHRRRGTA
jgi:hypothetical protein